MEEKQYQEYKEMKKLQSTKGDDKTFFQLFRQLKTDAPEKKNDQMVDPKNIDKANNSLFN